VPGAHGEGGRTPGFAGGIDSRRIAAAVERCCPVAHTPSIDKMVCELMGREQEPLRARQIALDIKQAIKDDVG